MLYYQQIKLWVWTVLEALFWKREGNREMMWVNILHRKCVSLIGHAILQQYIGNKKNTISNELIYYLPPNARTEDEVCASTNFAEKKKMRTYLIDYKARALLQNRSHIYRKFYGKSRLFHENRKWRVRSGLRGF